VTLIDLRYPILDKKGEQRYARLYRVSVKRCTFIHPDGRDFCVDSVTLLPAKSARITFLPEAQEKLRTYLERGHVLRVYGDFHLPDGTNAFYLHAPYSTTDTQLARAIKRFIGKKHCWYYDAPSEVEHGKIQDYAVCRVFKHYDWTPEGLVPRAE